MNETCGIFRANWYCLEFAFFVQLAIGMAPDDNDDDDQCVEEIEMRESSVDDDMSDYIHINVTNEFGVDENVDNMWVVLCPNYLFASTMAEYEIKLFDICYCRAAPHYLPHANNHHVANVNHDKHEKNPWQKHSKLIFLLVAWFLSTAFMTTEDEKILHHKLLSIDPYATKSK